MKQYLFYFLLLTTLQGAAQRVMTLKDDGTIKVYSNAELRKHQDRIDGIRIVTDSLDGILTETRFANGKPNGLSRYYHSNGLIHEQGNYVQGEKHGKWYYWDEEGVLTKTEVYQNGLVMGLGEHISEVWLPQKYVEALQNKDAKANEYLFPIEGMGFQNGETYIQMYNDEGQNVNLKKVIIAGVEKYELPNLKTYVNLRNNSREYADKISKTKFYISFENDKLLLEIEYEGTIEKIYYISEIDGYTFKNIYGSKELLENKWK